MSLNLFADECVHGNIVKKLRDAGYKVKYIAEEKPGISDKEIVEMIAQVSGILITEDSDYGEWVFVHRYTNPGIIFLRYDISQIDMISDAILTLIQKKATVLHNKFVVITTKKIRIREI